MLPSHIDPTRFRVPFANTLRVQGATPSQYCVIYRIEDKQAFGTATMRAQQYTDSELQRLRNAERQAFQRLYAYLNQYPGQTTTPRYQQLANQHQACLRAIQDRERAMSRNAEDSFLLSGAGHPEIVYSPGQNHKLEYNLIWVHGVARARKNALVLSQPTRRNFLRRADNGAVSAFGYELGALYKSGYRPYIGDGPHGRRLVLEPREANRVTRREDIAPSLLDIQSMRSAIEDTLFPGLLDLGGQLTYHFHQIGVSDQDVENHYDEIRRISDALRQEIDGTSPEFVRAKSLFNTALDSDIRDMMLSTFTRRIAASTSPIVQAHFGAIRDVEQLGRNRVYDFHTIDVMIFTKVLDLLRAGPQPGVGLPRPGTTNM